MSCFIEHLWDQIPDLVVRIWKAVIIRENTVLNSSSQSVGLKVGGAYMLSCKLGKCDLLHYPQTEENVKKEIEEWSKQADETKSEGWYHMLHKNSKSVSQGKIIEDSRNIPRPLKTNNNERRFLTLHTLSQRLLTSLRFKFRGWTFHKLFFHHSGRRLLLYTLFLFVLISKSCGQ